MVLEDFYIVKSKTEIVKNKSYVFNVSINKNHKIFKGHFPNNPIMPGVCMLQITKDITEGLLGSELLTRKCVSVKFTAIINPEVNSELVLDLTILSDEDGIVKIKQVTKFNDTVALKLTVIYKKIV